VFEEMSEEKFTGKDKEKYHLWRVVLFAKLESKSVDYITDDAQAAEIMAGRHAIINPLPVIDPEPQRLMYVLLNDFNIAWMWWKQHNEAQKGLYQAAVIMNDKNLNLNKELQRKLQEDSGIATLCMMEEVSDQMRLTMRNFVKFSS
jgi:hypothetical protein